MFTTVILLLNLLIATFTYNISKLQEKERKIWCIYRREIIFEHFNSPALPHPFSLILYVRGFIMWFRKFCPDKTVHVARAIHISSKGPGLFVDHMLSIHPEESQNGGRKILQMVERWEKLMADSVQEEN